MNMADRKTIGLEEGWNFMQKNIEKLINNLEGDNKQEFTSEEYIQIYDTVYNMCTQKPPRHYSEQLYDKYRKSMEYYITKMVLPALREKHNESMLRELVKRWETYKKMVKWLSHVFSYLDCYYIRRHSLPTLNEVGLTCFCDLVYQKIRDNVKDAVITLINIEREGEQIDRALLEDVHNIFVEIGMGSMDFYEKDFEVAMLEGTASYYSPKAAKWFEDLKSYPDYMKKAEKCLEHEEERVAHYLHSCSKQKLLEKVKNLLLFQYESRLLEKADSVCRALLKDDKVEDLSDMYRLFRWIPNGLAQIFKEHVTGEVTSLLKHAEDTATNNKAGKEDMVGAQEQALVRKVIELHDKYLQYVSKFCFANYCLFDEALREAFEVFSKKGFAGSTSAELLATFCDNILKKGGSEKLSDEDIKDTVEKVVKLVKNISDKDLFAEFYRKNLARRLLFDKSLKYDHEIILTKLKHHCGNQYTSKMERMVTDLTLAKESQKHFKDYLENNLDANPGIGFTVTVLTTGSWPSYKSFDLNLPDEMVRCTEVFKQFYQTQAKHRKLTWIYSLGTCIINGKFDPGPKELLVTTYQASALLLFNASERLSYSEVKTQLNLTDEDVVRLLRSLSCAKHKILNKEPNTKTVAQTDYFEFNSKFTDTMKKIKIPLPPVAEKKKVIEDVDKDRRYAIDASIVRIMKNKKVLAHQELVMECVKQLEPNFKPDDKAIKKRIEDLIKREFLERDKDNPHTYRYLA